MLRLSLFIKCIKIIYVKRKDSMKNVAGAERKKIIPSFTSTGNWQRATPNKVVKINFDSLEENLNNKMRLNASSEAKSIELAASFRTNS